MSKRKPLRIPVATGLSHGNQAYPEHAAHAVKQALARANLDRANGVLLFLTPEFAPDPSPAIRAAAGAAGCLQVIGCTGAGVLTDQEWILDSPAAAAMVFGGSVALDINPRETINDPLEEEPRLSFCTPSGLTSDWLDITTPRLGAVSGDLFGHGPFKTWTGARVTENGQAEALITGAHGIVEASQGVKALTSPIEVAETSGYDVMKLGGYPALNVLIQSLPQSVKEKTRIPYHLLMGGITFGDPDTAIQDGRYRLNHIISADPKERSITLSSPTYRGERLFWAMRDTLISERTMKQTIRSGYERLGNDPDFALLFPCMGRGPHFYGNRDRDLDLLKAKFPGMPIIGFYGNGEIGPMDGANHLYQYSSILGLYRARPPA